MPPSSTLLLTETCSKRKEKKLTLTVINDPLTLFTSCWLHAALPLQPQSKALVSPFKNVFICHAYRWRKKQFPGCQPKTGRQQNTKLEAIKDVFLAACYIQQESSLQWSGKVPPNRPDMSLLAHQPFAAVSETVPLLYKYCKRIYAEQLYCQNFMKDFGVDYFVSALIHP